MSAPVHCELIRMIFVKFRESAQSMRRQKFIFVENIPVDPLQFGAICNRKEQSRAAVCLLAHIDVFGHIFVVVQEPDRKSTRLNSSHPSISYAVFCLKKKNNK